ncbi:hypothetical protein ACFL6F_01130 [Planctomycetota bacterium]
MGVTLHFQGKVESVDNRKSLISELEDICKDMKWDYNLLDEDDNVEGIVISVDKGCDPLPFLFDKTGKLCSVSTLVAFEEDADYKYYVSVKTQFTTLDAHIAIIKLLKYIKRKYINDLNVTDEGKYWETEDKNLLEFRSRSENWARHR